MIDNWSLTPLYYKTLNASTPTNNYLKVCWQNILMAIVLWDELNFIPNKSTKSTNPSVGFATLKEKALYEDTEGVFGERYSLVKSIIREISFDAASSEFLSSVKVGLSEMIGSLGQEELRQIYAIIQRAPHDSEYLSRIRSQPSRRGTFLRTFLYSTISSIQGMSYLPHPIRADLIKQHNLLDRLYNRMLLLNPVETELKQYYEHINKSLGKTAFVCKYPLLYDFIKSNAADMNEELVVAIDIRNEPDVKSFRKSLSLLDVKVNAGNVEALRLALKQIEDLAKQIMSKHNSESVGELQIGLIPPTVNVNFSMPIKKRNNSLNLTFMSRLIDFGIHERFSRNRH
jgi:hypothetical protein